MKSRTSGRDKTRSNSAESRTVRVIGPATRPRYGGFTGMRPKLGFNAKMPQCVAGKRTEPPMSVPMCKGPYPAAAAAPAPDDDPEVLRSSRQGLRVMPCTEELPDDSMPKSGIVVLPSSTQPASRARAADGASSALGAMELAAQPIGAGSPLV